MKNDTIKIFKATISALCLGFLLYCALYFHGQVPTPGTILLQNTLQGTDKLQVFDSRLSPFGGIEGRPPLFSLYSQEAREFVNALTLNETSNVMSTTRGIYEFRFFKGTKILAKLYYSKGGFSSSSIRWPQGTKGAQYGTLVGPLKPRSRVYVDSVLQRHLTRPQPQ